MWRATDKQGNESSKIRWDIVPFTRGAVLEVGCGPWKAFPHFTGLDNMDHAHRFGWQFKPDSHIEDATDLSRFGAGAWDALYSSHTLEHIEDYKAALAEWWRCVKVGGHLVLYLPHADYYPNIGDRERVKKWVAETSTAGENIEQATARLIETRRKRGIKSVGKLYAGTVYANEDHRHDFIPKDITDAMMEVAPGWDLIENEDRNEGTEYSFYQAYRKRDDKRCVVQSHPWKKPGSKMACVCRFGGFGDMVQTSSILPALKAEGYHVTVMTTPKGKSILENDPHIDSFLLQDPDQVPNHELGNFWGVWQKKFDRWINLSESIEGTLLAIPGRMNHGWPDALRRKMMGANYLEWTHAVADVPGPPKPAFYPSDEERAWFRKQDYGRSYLIMWALAGSSVHKAYPHMDAVVAKIMMGMPEAKVIMVGDGACELLEAGWEKEERVIRTSGKWSIRQTLTAALEVDAVVGPETGVMNAVALCDNAKIVMLSHSSPENLTKHWINTDTIVPDVPCHPCHRMHYGREFCPEWKQPVEESDLPGNPKVLQEMIDSGHVVNGMFSTGASICAASIPPALIYERILTHYDIWRARRIVASTG